MSLFTKEALKQSQRKYLLKKQPEDPRDFLLSTKLWPIQTLPPKRSLRGLLFNPPIYNQGALGSCSANAVAFAYQYGSKKQRLLFSDTPSRLFIYYNSRMIGGNIDVDSGAYLRDSVKWLVKYGTVSEKEYPYNIEGFALKPSDQNYQNAIKNTIDGYYAVNKDIQDIKRAIYNKFPVVFGMSIYGAINYVTKENPILSMSTNEWLMGWHALVIIWYDDSTQLFLVRNSWGDKWADNGYFYVPYEYIMKYGFDFWVISKV